MLSIKLHIVMETATDKETSSTGEQMISLPCHITAVHIFVFAVFLCFISTTEPLGLQGY